jgi:hypothetical protein
LPLAPRPRAGEAVSSWVGRVGARYDILGDELLEYVLDRPRRVIGIAGTLDYRADPELESALAYATRIAPETISDLRIAGDDGRYSCWHRWVLAWCPSCLSADLADYEEVYQRAIWRLGCCVVCPLHKLRLEDRCWRCPFEARCSFHCSGGLLNLACDTCGSLQGPAPRCARDNSTGTFGISITPSLNGLIGMLQSDLQGALKGVRPRRSWGFQQGAGGLLTAIRDLTLCLILATRVRCEPRIILPKFVPGETFAAMHEPITPAALSTQAAYGALGIAAAVLSNLERSNDRHIWNPDGETSVLTIASFLTWLPPDVAGHLKVWSTRWEAEAGQALRAAIADVEGRR